MKATSDSRFLIVAAGAMLVAGPLAVTGSGRNFHADQAVAPPAKQDNSANIHRVSVQFDYDFGKNPACGEKPTAKTCVKQFDVYDVSGGRFKLFSIPAPDGAKGLVKGITGQSPARIFLPGTHYLAVTAENTEGVESDTDVAKIRVEIKARTDTATQTK